MARTILDTAPRRIALGGPSMGERIALGIMRIAPERVMALGLFDTGYLPMPAGSAAETEAERRYALLEVARRDGMRAMGRKWIVGMVHPARRDDRALIDEVLDMFEA